MRNLYIIGSFLATIIFSNLTAQKGTVLVFLPQDQCYYSEYIVMVEALKASGYQIDVRSATENNVSAYMIPANTTIDATANSLNNSSYFQFTNQFLNNFNIAWNAQLNTIPSQIEVNGKIQDVPNLNNYVALVMSGGTGMINYRVDGSYTSNGIASNLDVQSAAIKLNDLGIEAMLQGKPVLAQCHGASIPVFWRIPNTSGTGAESLGFSLLKGNNASGFPETETATVLSALGVNYLPEDRVTISSPHESLNDGDNGNYKIITSRDWYPQTVLYATKTLINILETYPHPSILNQNKSVLILHGGAVDINNCSAANKNNDIPCNYGTGNSLPADYTDLQNLFLANSVNDNYNFVVSDLNLTGDLPFDNSNQTQILNYFKNYDVVVFYKHWSTGVTNAIQNALVTYADEGGGVLGLHHGLYNDVTGNLNKDILVNNLFGVQSAMQTWSANLTNYNLFSTNHGHFITSYGINYSSALPSPNVWTQTNHLPQSNLSFSTYSSFSIFDELYNNMDFIPGTEFGNDDNQVMPLLSNNQSPSTQVHTSGFYKIFNPSLDETKGKVVYFEAGERKENYVISNPYAQLIRNATFWLGNTNGNVTSTKNLKSNLALNIYPNPCAQFFTIPKMDDLETGYATLLIFNTNGEKVMEKLIFTNQKNVINVDDFSAGVYFLQINTQNKILFSKLVKY